MQKIIGWNCCIAFVWFCASADAFDKELAYAPLAAKTSEVPQNLLKLVHTPEVQRELGIDDSNRPELESILRKIDLTWWPIRILAKDKQRVVVAELETQLVEKIEKLLGGKAVLRLRQIELQSQGYRMLVRPEIADWLKLTTDQLKQIETMIHELDQAKSSEGQEPKPLDANRVQSLLSPAQQKKIQLAIGKTFDTLRLSRIYPLAPELIDTGFRVGDGDVSLESLKGKVVLVHFYAFQCHNCIANFNHYKRWDQTLQDKGVAVVGIQTPELPDERDPVKVTRAAQKEGFQFPVIIDTSSKNWNAWGNTMWPTVYVVDKNGYIRYWWQGELNWQGATGDKTIEKLIDELLNES